jgi:hypothetical protein
MATGRVPTTANSPLTAKGDLFGYSTTQARVAVGNDGETLVADSSTSTGLRYTAGTVQANPFINSAFQVWQRGTSIAMTTTSYTADRWQGYRGVAGSTVSRQATNDTTNLPNIQYCARVQRDSGNTSTSTIYFGQGFESVNSIPFAGKTVTFSFYARKGADYSQASSQVSFLLQGGALTDANVITSGGWSTIATLAATLTTTWQRFSITATVSTTYTQLGTYGVFNAVGTAGAADYFEVTGFQLDIGSVALPFRTNAGTIQGELAACQRYFYSWNTANANDASGNICYLAANTSVAVYGTLQYPVTMRTSPSFTSTAASGFQYYMGSARVLSALSQPRASIYASMLNGTVTGATVGQAGWLEANNNTGYLWFSAEL